MATHRWIAQTPSSWTGTSFDSGSTPSSNDIVRFDGTGQGDVIGGLDQSAIDLDLLEIHPSYFGRIGVDGNPLIISADEVVHQGRNTLHYQDGNGSTDVMIIQSDNLVQAAKLYSGTVTRMRVNRGKVILGHSFSTEFQDLEIGHTGRPDTDAQVVKLGSAASFVRMRMNAGFLDNVRPIALGGESAVMSGGNWRLTSGFLSPVWITGGLVNWDTSILSPGVSALGTTLYLMGGTLDARSGGAKAITNLYLDPNNAEFLYNEDTMTVTTTHRMEP